MISDMNFLNLDTQMNSNEIYLIGFKPNAQSPQY